MLIFLKVDINIAIITVTCVTMKIGISTLPLLSVKFSSFGTFDDINPIICCKLGLLSKFIKLWILL